MTLSPNPLPLLFTRVKVEGRVNIYHMIRQLLFLLALSSLLLAACGGTPIPIVETTAQPTTTATQAPQLTETPTSTPELVGQAVAELAVSVYDAISGQPVADAKVVAFQMDAYYVEERSTDVIGQAAFTDLPSVGTRSSQWKPTAMRHSAAGRMYQRA